MKALQWRPCKKTILLSIGLLVLALSLPLLPAAHASSTEYMDLTARGSSMYPTIVDGDRITVRLCTNGSLINVGDIIVYGSIAAMAYNPNPKCIFIGHRVTARYEKGDTWYFKTKGDNNTDPDPWEVPDYWLLGVVTSIDHTGKPYVPAEPSTQTDYASTYPDYSMLIESCEVLLLIAVGFALGKVCTRAAYSRKSRDNNNIHVTRADEMNSSTETV